MNGLSKWMVGLPLVMACDAQTDKGYRGEALAEMRGVVAMNAALSAGTELEVTLVWDYDNGDGDEVKSQRAAIKGEFPARFTLDLSEPPPAEVLSREGPNGEQGGYAYIMVLPKGGDPYAFEDGGVTPFGVSTEYMVMWSKFDFAAGSYEAQRYGDVKAGYNLMRVTPVETWLAAHPETTHCGDFWDPKCDTVDAPPEPEDCDAYYENWDEDAEQTPACLAWEYEVMLLQQACHEEAARAAGCWEHELFGQFDRLSPAEGGFANEVAITVSDDFEATFGDTFPNIH